MSMSLLNFCYNFFMIIAKRIKEMRIEKKLTQKQELSDDDFEEIAELEMYLNEIPDYLALGITTEYQRIKMEFENREDL